MVLWEPPRQSRGIGSGHFALGAWRSIAARPAGAASAAVRTAFPSLLGSEPLSLRPFYAVCSGARGSRSLASTFAVTTLLSSLGLLLPQPTSAAYLVERVETTPSARFINGDECAPATVAVPLKRGAFAIRVLDGPRPGETLFGRDTDQQVGVVTGVRVRPRQRAVFWDAAPLPGGCRAHYGEPDYDQDGNEVFGPPEYYSWSSEVYEFFVAYRRRERVRLTRSSAARLASVALSRRFGDAYNLAEGYPRCRRPRRNRSTCSITFFQGDVYWVGRVRVGVGTSRNHRKLHWSYKLNVLFVNDYCHQVNNQPFSECSRRIRKTRKRIPVPRGRL